MNRYSSSNKNSKYNHKIQAIFSRKSSNQLDKSSRVMLGQSAKYQPVSHRRNQSGLLSRQIPLNTSKSNNKSRVYELNQLVQSIYLSVEKSKCTNKIQFLRILYQKKSQDLKAIKNLKHQASFVQRMKQKLTDQMLVASQCELGVNSCKYISQYLPLTSIVKLVLNNNPLGDEGIKILSGVFPQLELVHLQLISINIGPKGSKILLQNLCKCPTLQYINLSSLEGLNRNKFNKQSVTQLQILFANQKCSIKSFSIQNSSIGQQGFFYICKGVNQHSKLKCLNVSGNQIKDLRLFLEKFRKIPLKKLILKNNSIGDNGIQILATIFGTQYQRNIIAKSLKLLDLSNNKIKSHGLEIFSRQMNNNQTLEELILDFNPLIEGQRFFNFKYYLTRNWTIKKLSLKQTIHSYQDFRHLKQGMQTNKSIICLNLSRISLQNDCFQAIIQMLAENKSIKTVFLDSCNISDGYLNKIEILQKNKTLNQISFQNNFIHDRGAYLLVQLLKKNKKIVTMNIKRNCVRPNIIKQINHLLKQNKIDLQCQQPDFSYFQYVEEIQSSQRSLLLTNIQKLKNKQQKQKLNQIICQIADKDKQISKVKVVINQEKRKINNLQNIISIKQQTKIKFENKQRIFCTSQENNY